MRIETSRDEAEGKDFVSTDIAYYYYSLGQVNHALEDFDTALINFKDAVQLEENNPKYLDMLIEISLIVRNRLLALDTLKKLKEVNPDNQKLEEFEVKIREM